MQDKKIKKFSKYTTLSNYESLKEYLIKCNAKMLEKQPAQPKDLYDYYFCIDGVYTWLRRAYNTDIPVLCNEMRAILGHLSEYDQDDDEQKKNLEKAYGHFRRLSIDTLKILCNAFDQRFDEWIHKYVKYDFRNIDATFFPDYVSLYHEAHNEYLQVQQAENLGSDRNNSIIEKYYNVAMKYLKVYEHHTKERRKEVEKKARYFNINKWLWSTVTFVLAIISLVDLFQ